MYDRNDGMFWFDSSLLHVQPFLFTRFLKLTYREQKEITGLYLEDIQILSD
jgi:hypothetical protein